ncbi:MAG: AraC family transcriptional regulator [Steroidobacteraceae bacterium]
MSHSRKLVQRAERVRPYDLYAVNRLSIGLIPFVDTLQDLGLNPDPILKRAGIRPSLLSDPVGFVSLQQELSLVRILEGCALPWDFGLRVGSRHRVTSLGVFGLALSTARTLMHALQIAERYPHVHWGTFELSLGQLGDFVLLELRNSLNIPSACVPMMIDRDLASTKVLNEELLGRTGIIEHIELPFRPAAGLSAYEQWFECPVSLNATHCRVLLSRKALGAPLPGAHPATCTLYLRQCNRLSRQSEASSTWQARVDRLVLSDHKIMKFDVIARKLCTTERSLRRKLAAEGLSYRRIVQSSQSELASKLLADTGLSIDAIGRRLGYGSGTAFTHAFTRWTGVSPKRYRALQVHRRGLSAGAVRVSRKTVRERPRRNAQR